MTKYLTGCSVCGAKTSRKYAREHQNKCKACFTGVPQETKEDNRNALIIDHGWYAYQREEGAYDLPDSY